MAVDTNHISVCICTYKRPELLQRLLKELRDQETNGSFTYSVVVVDNDRQRSAESVVSEFAASSTLAIQYCNEPRQGIALARNNAVENAAGDFIAFIDDDEFPVRTWLASLFGALERFGCDGVLGPVKPHFGNGAPGWVVKSGIYDRPSHPTGLVLDWRKTRSGNVLFKKNILPKDEQAFRPQFRSGEDVDFFRRMIDRGRVFVWCEEAVAYEAVPDSRWKRTYMLRRALLRGVCSKLQPTFGIREIATSIVAIPVYTVALPFAFLLGQAKFMPLAISLFDHVGRMLAVFGMDPIKQPYVTD